MATVRGIGRVPLTKTEVSVDRAANRRIVLRAIEAALTKARIDAEAIDYPLLAYLLEMAIAEVKNSEGINRGPQNKKNRNSRFMLCLSQALKDS